MFWTQTHLKIYNIFFSNLGFEFHLKHHKNGFEFDISHTCSFLAEVWASRRSAVDRHTAGKCVNVANVNVENCIMCQCGQTHCRWTRQMCTWGPIYVSGCPSLSFKFLYSFIGPVGQCPMDIIYRGKIVETDCLVLIGQSCEMSNILHR